MYVIFYFFKKNNTEWALEKKRLENVAWTHVRKKYKKNEIVRYGKQTIYGRQRRRQQEQLKIGSLTFRFLRWGL